MPALATLLLLLFSASADIGNSKALDRPLHPATNGLGAPFQTNEASNIAAAAGRALWVAQSTRLPGSKGSVAVLDGHGVQKTALVVSCSRLITFTANHDSAIVRIRSVRAPPVVSFAI